jgi:hypothetical protein
MTEDLVNSQGLYYSVPTKVIRMIVMRTLFFLKVKLRLNLA